MKFSKALADYLDARDNLNKVRGHRWFEAHAQAQADRAAADLDQVWGTLRLNEPQSKQTGKK